jgi:hypothetical protein
VPEAAALVAVALATALLLKVAEVALTLAPVADMAASADWKAFIAVLSMPSAVEVAPATLLASSSICLVPAMYEVARFLAVEAGS